MTHYEKAMQAVTEAIDELNEQLPKDEKLKKSVDTVLFASGGNLDSLRLVSFVTTIEQKIEEKFGRTVTLLSDIDALENDNPFRTVNSLADYVASILEKNAIE
jgi:acyl carrier protein